MRQPFKIHEDRKQTNTANDEDIFNDLQETCQKRLSSLKQKQVRKITPVLVRRIMRAYFTIIFNEAVFEGKRSVVYQWFGFFYAAKTLCTRYNPKSFYFVTINGKKQRLEKKIDVNKTNGFFYFMFWDSPIKWRNYRLRLCERWSKSIFENAMSGFDYIDISLLKNTCESYKSNSWHKRQDYQKKADYTKTGFQSSL